MSVASVQRVSPAAIAKQDLRHVARATIPRRPLEAVIAGADGARESEWLWLADPWPWTPGTEAAIDARRPRWAAARIEIVRVRPLATLDAESAVRELNRAFDPWPADSRAR